MRLRLRPRFVSIDAARRDAILQEIDQNAALGQNFLVLVLLSCVIATFGLIQNSAAVIIGAMLVAPLMGPIVAFALALVYGDPRRVARALGTLALGAAIAVALSALLGLLVTLVGTVDFGATGLPSEILGRTQPSLFDLAVALAGGTAGSYALVQPRLSSALAGVAIATALMPPLCVVGLGISQGDMAIWGGSLLLFLTNVAAIVFAASGIFALAGFLPAAGGSRRRRLPHARLVNLLLLLPVVVLLTAFTINITQQTQLTAAIRVTLTRELQRHRNTSLVHVDRSADGGTLDIVATIRSPATLTLSEAQSIEAALAARLRQRVALNLLVVPVTSLDPLESADVHRHIHADTYPTAEPYRERPAKRTGNGECALPWDGDTGSAASCLADRARWDAFTPTDRARHRDCHAHELAHEYSHPNGHPDGGPHANAAAECYADGEPHAKAATKRDADAERNPHAAAQRHGDMDAAAEPDQHPHPSPHPDADSGAHRHAIRLCRGRRDRWAGRLCSALARIDGDRGRAAGWYTRAAHRTGGEPRRLPLAAGRAPRRAGCVGPQAVPGTAPHLYPSVAVAYPRGAWDGR